ncbi:MAG: thioredoxin family protein [Anaerolineae bacterium]|nr:thioredoxin family protein [Anaerolineae bacterium]
MLTIKVLGPGCPNCQKVEQHTREALAMMQPEGEVAIIKVTDPVEISNYIMRTPGLVINEQVVSEGRIPRSDEVMTWIANALQGA